MTPETNETPQICILWNKFKTKIRAVGTRARFFNSVLIALLSTCKRMDFFIMSHWRQVPVNPACVEGCVHLCIQTYRQTAATVNVQGRLLKNQRRLVQCSAFLALCRLSTDRPGTTSAARLIRYSLCCKTAKYSNLIHTLHVCVLAGWSSVCSLTLFVSVSVFFWLIDTHTHTNVLKSFSSHCVYWMKMCPVL